MLECKQRYFSKKIETLIVLPPYFIRSPFFSSLVYFFRIRLSGWYSTFLTLRQGIISITLATSLISISTRKKTCPRASISVLHQEPQIFLKNGYLITNIPIKARNKANVNATHVTEKDLQSG